jgi:hypothetical protein
MKNLLLIAAFAVCVAAPVALAQTSIDVPVTSIISDYDSGIGPALQIQSDGAGSYTNSRTLKSLIQSVGSWVLDSYFVSKSTRTVYLNFDQGVPGSGANGGNPAAFAAGRYKVHLISKCERYGGSLLTMAPGSTIQCPLDIRFDYNGAPYLLHMNPQNSAWAATNPVNVTCIVPSSGSGPCTQWRFYPSGTYLAPDGTTQLRNVADLSKESTVKGQTVLTTQGNYYFSFQFIVTRP